jgi:hypothetical protein
MGLRDTMRSSAAQYLQPGDLVQAVIRAQTVRQWLAALTGMFVSLGFSRHRIVAVMPTRILVPEAGACRTIAAGVLPGVLCIELIRRGKAAGREGERRWRRLAGEGTGM